MSFFKNSYAGIMAVKTRRDVKKQTERPTKVYKTAPKPFDGVDGEQRLIDTGKTKYLYSKMNGMWLKTKLTKPSESDESIATTTTESTSGEGGGGITSNSAKAIIFNYYYDTGDGSDYLEGWSNYLDACKETEPAGGYAVTSKTDAAHNGLSNGSVMRDSTVTTSSLIIPVGLSNSGSGVRYFSTETIDGNSGDTGKKLFALNYQGVISQVRSRIPNTISVTESGTTSSNEITVALAGNTQVTESIRLYWKLNSAGSYGANDYVNITIGSSDRLGSWSDTYIFNATNNGLTPQASTAYKFKTEPRNTASQQNVGTATESEVITTPGASGSWTVPNDFTITAIGSGNTGSYAHANKQIVLTNGNTGNNSTTVSWTKDSGNVLNPGFAISTTGSPGSSGGPNGWNTGNNASATIDLGSASATLYITFRHQFKGSFVGYDANMSVTFSNTSGNVADNSELDITMVNSDGFAP